jgi:hypothetical protein
MGHVGDIIVINTLEKMVEVGYPVSSTSELGGMTRPSGIMSEKGNRQWCTADPS